MAESETTGDAGGESERGSSRGTGFPVMDLSTAVELVHRVGEYGGNFTASTFAQYLGHKTANSGPFRSKVASLKDWGLVTTKGGRMLLTDLGKEVAKSPDPAADPALLRDTFDSCKIFKAFYDETARGVALKRETLGRAAVFDHKVSAKSQEQFVSMLVDSAVTVGLAEPDAEAGTVTFKSPAASTKPDARQHEDRMSEPLRNDPEPDRAWDADGATRRRQPAPPPAADSTVPVLLRQVWRTATGAVVLAIHSTDPLPASAFALVGRVVQAAEDLAKSIGLPAPVTEDEDDAS
jgi:hypothetical protein